MSQLFLIAFRSLLQHRTRSMVLGGAIAVVTALLICLTGVYTGMRDTLLLSATTLMSGHVNVGGFYKVTAGQSAPVVTGFKKVMEVVKKEVPELDYMTQRGRGWAKLVSDTGSMQVGIGGIDITQEPGFVKVVVVKSGNLDDMKKPDSLMIFEEQAKKLDAKVGDRLTISAPTFKGTNNTIDVTVVAIAQNVGMLSSWNVYVSETGLRQLYALNQDTTGAVLIYLKDLKAVPLVQKRLREAFAREGWQVMDPNANPFWMKFDSVNRESWTGQKLDITNWEDETAFVKWFLTLFSAASVMVIFVAVVIIGVGMMNVMWISIRERTREIGTLRAIGMQRTRVLVMFVTEGFLLGLFGTCAGVLLGLVMAVGLTRANIGLKGGAQLVMMTDHVVITPTLFWAAFAVIFLTGAITLISVIPSFLAARLKPVTAMSHVG
jgi:putative ABC transport system permease protein